MPLGLGLLDAGPVPLPVLVVTGMIFRLGHSERLSATKPTSIPEIDPKQKQMYRGRTLDRKGATFLFIDVSISTQSRDDKV